MVKALLWTIGIAGAFVLSALIFLRRVWFYRDPIRKPPSGNGLILSPADGKVIYIRPIKEGKIYAEKIGERIELEEIHKVKGDAGREGWIIGIYMSPLDVHFNYSPIAGRVEKIVHTQTGLNLPMVDLWEYIRLTYLRRAVDLFARRYHLINERNTIFIKGRDLRLAVVEIADKFVNKITCFVKNGDQLKPGQKLSFIARGSQVDLIIFHKEIEFVAAVGDQVYGAQSILARVASAGRGLEGGHESD